MKYFDFNLTDEVHPLYIDDERKIYELLTSGLPALTKIMEVYASDRFKRLSVYKLITDKTVEENIRKLQLSKKELSDIAVNGDGDIMHMSAEDIMAILN